MYNLIMHKNVQACLYHALALMNRFEVLLYKSVKFKAKKIDSFSTYSVTDFTIKVTLVTGG